MLRQNAGLIAAALALVALAWLLVRDALSRREQKKLAARLKRDSEQQARAILLLNQALSETAERVSAGTGELSERQDRLRDSLDRRMDSLRRSNEETLEQLRSAVTDKLDRRLSESFQTVNRQLADVHRGLGQMHELAGEFSDIKKMLGGVKTRGVWGEAQLRALLEQLLAPGQYLENAAIPEDSQTRVEFAVRLPAADGEALLPIDSKFPQEDFLRLAEAAQSGDAAQTAACAARLERALREQAKQISTKYIRPPQTADFAVMFLPVESLYAEAVRIPGLCERLQNEYRVLVAGPNTLAALLTSLRMGFRTVSLERRSGEVLRALTKIQSEFEACEQSARQVRQRLAQAADALDALDARNRKFARALRELSDGEDGE